MKNDGLRYTLDRFNFWRLISYTDSPLSFVPPFWVLYLHFCHLYHSAPVVTRN